MTASLESTSTGIAGE